MFTWVPHGLKTLRPKEEDNTTRRNTMKFIYRIEGIEKLDDQIQELQQTLSNISARSNRLLMAMEADSASSLTAAGDLNM